MLNQATKIYKKSLWNSPTSLNYLIKGRGLAEETINNFSLGYCNSDEFYKTVKDKKQEAIEIGLIRGIKEEDFFKGCVTFPIFDGKEVVNIYGRSLKENLPHKILPHSSKAIPYNKNSLNKSNSIIIVESPICALTLEQNGFYAVALVGTGLPKKVISLFKGKNCYLLLDSDEAGIKAANAAVGKLFLYANSVHILDLPDKDPNDFFRNNLKAKDRLFFLIKNSWPIEKPPFLSHVEKTKKNNIEDNVSIIEVGKKLFKDYKENSNSIWVKCEKHKDTKPSLWVGGNKNIFTCFGCNITGGPVTLVSWQLSLTEEQAREWIKERFK